MKNLYIYCEGQTEEGFINEVLYPYLFNIGICAKPIVCTTKRINIKKFRGGVGDYQKIKKELTILCRQHKNESVTTMFDYYGIPANTPGIANESGSLYDRIACIEMAIQADINMPNLFFNLTVHEFEALLFSAPLAFNTIVDNNIVERLQCIKEEFISPEYINNSLDTAPSKRIESLIPGYSKVINGTVISRRIGVDAMLAECRHFQEWILKIKSLNQ